MKIGVYTCHCGSNIAGKVDCEAAAQWAGELENVEISRDYKFMCSSLGQELIEEDIKEYGLDRIVVASCSPHMHEPTFRSACQRAGLNPYFFEMANIREHASWVHTERDQATEKAKALIGAAVARVRYHEPLHPQHAPVNQNTLVVGGGVAGIQAALEIANAGYHVYLVEREPSIGGHMAQLDKTFPTLDCSACILTPRMFEAGNHKNITMLTYSEVEKVSGFIGNFTVHVRERARSINQELCTGCGVCEEKCPKTIIDTVFESGLGYRKAVYRPFPQAVPKYPVIDRENCIWFERGKCRVCEKFCPTHAIDFDQKDRIHEIDVGNIIVATGYDAFDARRIPQYGYGRYPNVFTALEFERMTNAAGPTDGKVLLRDGVTPPESVAIVHCVGSRDVRYREHCSRVCCMYSLKFAHMAHEKLPGSTVYNFYIDIRTPGKDYEEFYHRLLEEGTVFIRGRAASISDATLEPEEEGKLIVTAEDTLIGRQRRIPVDMVVLSTGLEPRHDSRDVARTFSISCSREGFFKEKHPKLDPIATMTDGIFVAGCAQGPRDIPDTVAQGAAAAARVLSIIGKGEVEIEAAIAEVNDLNCVGCRMCVESCPYSAIEYLEDRQKARVNQALCKGCGTCIAACPSKVITLHHFTDEQLVAQMYGAMNALYEMDGLLVPA
ncbi:MAG: CoB--CoM heterodisulfide reductase iron-sulfur subunit A family protein [Anaerolineales bacterium]|nr:CoB--CoM heterodisulfide reductase iron-sulfur subunit A family protein [Anaerolineales bacterium]